MTKGGMGVPDPKSDRQFYAGVPVRRLIAFVIDFIVVLILSVLVLFVGAIIVAAGGWPLGPIIFLGFTLAGFFYRWIMLVQRSATLGMLLTGIEVRDANGDRMTKGTAFLHTAGYYVTFFFPPLAFIGWILMATSPYRRTMHDLFMQAVVINRPA
jgi:uncharacterized RDD family membrane protein YckC